MNRVARVAAIALATSTAIVFGAVASDISTTGPRTRVERDLLGEKQVPADAYYGVQTARALENFQISNIPDELLSGVRRGVRDREARRRARQHARSAR